MLRFYHPDIGSKLINGDTRSELPSIFRLKRNRRCSCNKTTKALVSLSRNLQDSSSMNGRRRSEVQGSSLERFPGTSFEYRESSHCLIFNMGFVEFTRRV